MLSGIGPAAGLRESGSRSPRPPRRRREPARPPALAGDRSSPRPMPRSCRGLTAAARPAVLRAAGPTCRARHAAARLPHAESYLRGMEGPADGFTLMGGMIRPDSRGRLSLHPPTRTSRRPSTRAYLAEESDVDALHWLLERCREIAQRRRSPTGRRGALSRPGRQHARGVRDYVRDTAITYHHQVGTCRMGADDARRRRPAAARPRRRRAARRRRLGHADRHVGQHERADDDDRREGGGRHPRRGGHGGQRAGVSARRTWSIVTTPRRTPSRSTANTAPRLRRPSVPSSSSSGSSMPICQRHPSSRTDVAGGERGLARGQGALDRLAVQDAGVAAVGLGHRHPRPAVGAEDLLGGVDDRHVGGDVNGCGP